MKYKKLERASWILQGVYSALCLVSIALNLLCRYDQSWIDRPMLDFLMGLTCLSCLLPAMPIGVALNIYAARERDASGAPMRGSLIWSILSPILYIICSLAVIVAFASCTGGV